MSVTVDEAGGQIVRYSWGHVTRLIETYWVREAFLWGEATWHFSSLGGPTEEKGGCDANSLMGTHKTASLLCRELQASWQGLFAFAYISEVL